MLSMLLIVGCQTTTTVVNKCPQFPWPNAQQAQELKYVGERSTAIQYWLVAVIRHAQTCDEMNKDLTND